MKITKSSFGELKALYTDLKKFLVDLKYDEIDFRMVVLEYSQVKAKIEMLSYFDSDKNQIAREVLDGANLTSFKTGGILSYLKMNEETAILESSLDLDDCDNGGKKQDFYVILDFKDKITMLLNDFLRRYEQEILRFFATRSSSTIKDLIFIKQDVFNDAVREYMDLDIVISLSASQYERNDSIGSIIYIKNQRDAVYKVKFTKEIDFNINNIRLIRKILEMSDRKLSLIIYEKMIVGLGMKDTPYRKVQFNGHQNWTLYISQRESLRYVRGNFFFDRDNSQYMINMPKGFIMKKFEKPFNSIINILMHQKNGALLIISDKAKEEVERLSNFHRGYAIGVIDFTNIENRSLVINLASVDGAVFIDRQLRCYGAGIILDGVAKSSGSNARGARYNSACCYLDNKIDAPYAAIVFSEDETVDLILNSVSQNMNDSAGAKTIKSASASAKRL